MGLNAQTDIETHPWEPFLPANAKVLFLGTFPPGSHRWSMNFYYPNPTNDFWRIMGLLFCGDRNALYDVGARCFHEDVVRAFAAEHGIALGDTAKKVRRLRGNASDKFLEIVEPVNLAAILSRIPLCHTVVATGEKAASVLAELTGTAVPPVGGIATAADGLRIWRVPSSSRAYPLALEKKAAVYRTVLLDAGVL